ncbi:DUF790 family protein [Lentisphaerota bacterium WC36G]|nr:DUF790 family protein [Lentisphaerae bacterium WC36]
MLSKDLLRFKRASGKIIPKYLKIDDKNILFLCNQLLQVLNSNLGKTKKELEKEVQMLLYSQKDLKLSKGIIKTIYSECIFSNDDNFDFLNERKEIFRIANTSLETLNSETSLECYREKVLKKLTNTQNELINSGLFSDHPDYEILNNFKTKITAEFIINKYNSQLIQSLIIYSNLVELTFTKPNQKLLRNFIGKLRFHRLLCRHEKNSNDCIKIMIDGPLNIFENSQKYGMQLAIILPYVYQFEDWSLKAKINFQEKNYTLTANSDLKLRPFYRHQNDYIPQEIRLFGKQFKEKNSPWKIMLPTEIFHINNEQSIFPDFKFINDNNVVFLELFHRWHHKELINRLQSLISGQLPENIFIGIDRAITKKHKDILNKLEEHKEVKHRFFLYRDFPTVSTVQKKLKSFNN